MNAKPTDHDDPRPTRSSGWVVFFLLGALRGVHAIYLMVLPSVEPDHWREFTTDPKMLAYLADDFRSAGAMQLGSAVMSMAVAGRWFRLADPWAWGLFWYFPALCAWSMLTTWAVGLFLTVGAIAVVALAATFRQFFPSRTR
jgi:hypothetical protein